MNAKPVFSADDFFALFEDKIRYNDLFINKWNINKYMEYVKLGE